MKKSRHPLDRGLSLIIGVPQRRPQRVTNGWSPLTCDGPHLLRTEPKVDDTRPVEEAVAYEFGELIEHKFIINRLVLVELVMFFSIDCGIPLGPLAETY